MLAYLAGAWRRGVLQGATPAQAFFVTCDRDPEAGGDGGLVIEVGLAVRQPADLHVLRIVQRS